MHTDPGWGSAFAHIAKALFSRRQLMAVRPAISAARAAAIAPVVTAIVLLFALTVFGAPAETDYPLTGAIIGVTVIAAGAAVWRIRYGSLTTPVLDADSVAQFLRYATLLTALAMVPTLSGFVCFFLGGGYLIYAVGALATVVLILGPAMPNEASVRSFAARSNPPIDGDELWQGVLDPRQDD